MAPYQAPIIKILICILMIINGVSGRQNYQEALSKSILFFEGQRSGKLPPNQRITWRSDSGLSDGSPENVDLCGGYYDAGDNVKFGLPMAFTTTMLSWSVIEYGKRMTEELHNAQEAIRWATDYLLKACSRLPDALYVQVGDPNADHNCWLRPEKIETPLQVYKVTPTNPGSEVAGETAAALAAASRVFKKVDPKYSKTLLETAKKAFEFGDKHKGNYSDPLASVVCPFYCSYSGYLDELQWGAAWLYRVTRNPSYLHYVKSQGVGSDCDTFSWDNKLLGTRVLLSRVALVEEDESVSAFREATEKYMCSVLPGSPSISETYTPGGLMYKMEGSNLQYVTTSTFLLTTYAKYLSHSDKTFACGDEMVVTPSLLRKQAKKQVDYILGDNPKGISYMVGFGENFPQRIHHRGSSLSSLQSSSGCKDGFSIYFDQQPNANILTGAIVGGPDKNDDFEDNRDNYAQSEPATYINAPFVGTLAYFATSHMS